MRTRASYQPQFAFPPTPPGFADDQFVQYYDAISTPILGATLAAHGEYLDIPLQIENDPTPDSVFIARALRIVGAARFQFREPSGSWLSSAFPNLPPVLRQSYLAQGLDLGPSGAFFQPAVSFEPEIYCRAGSFFLLYLYNPAAAPAAVAGFISIEGVKRRRIHG